MDPIRLYDYLARSRAEIFDAIRPLSAEQYGREFPFGLGSIRKTIPHMVNAEWVYVHRILAQDVPDKRPIDAENPPEFPAAEAVWNQQADRTREALAQVRDWATTREYRRRWIDGDVIVTASPDEFFAQLYTHEIHHRSQVMAMLRQMGAPAQDLDYSILMHPRRPA